MGAIPTAESTPAVKPALRGWSLIVAGYSVSAAGLVAFLTINGALVPGVATAVTSALVILGLVLPALGMLQMARGVDPVQRGTRRGLEMQAAGLIALLLGVVLIDVLSSFSGYVAGAGLVTMSWALALTGVAFFRRYTGSVVILALGMILIFLGVELIAGSDIAMQEYWISQVEKTIYTDIGATVSACGCVVSAYFFFVLRGRS